MRISPTLTTSALEEDSHPRFHGITLPSPLALMRGATVLQAHEVELCLVTASQAMSLTSNVGGALAIGTPCRAAGLLQVAVSAVSRAIAKADGDGGADERRMARLPTVLAVSRAGDGGVFPDIGPAKTAAYVTSIDNVPGVPVANASLGLVRATVIVMTSTATGATLQGAFDGGVPIVSTVETSLGAGVGGGYVPQS